jgi:hypothetical protein
LVAVFAFCLVARADIVYDNSLTYQGAFHAATNEFGDEISLAGTARMVNMFLFEYNGDFTPQGDEQARVRFYVNDGPGIYAKPRTLLFDSGTFPLFTNFNTKIVMVPNVVVPDSFTWSVQFYGMTQRPGDRAGVLWKDPPTVGAQLDAQTVGSYDDFWQNFNGLWSLYQIPDQAGVPHVVANLACRVYAVPEPSILALGLLGGLAWLGRRCWRDRP